MTRYRRVPSRQPRRATVKMAAAMQVVPYGPEIEEGVGTRAEWTARMAYRYGPTVAMVRVLQLDGEGLARLARDGGEECAFELERWLRETAEIIAAEAGLMHQAAVRVMCGMARMAMEGGGA